MILPDTWTDDLTPEMVKKAEVDLGETPETRERALEQLRELIANEPGFEPLTDDLYLLQFIRGRKYDIRRAFTTLKNCYAFRQKHSGVYMDFIPSEVERVYDLDSIFISPKRDSTGSHLCVLYMGRIPDKIPMEEWIAAAILISEVAMATPATQICSAVGLIDWKGATARQYLQLTKPSFIKFIGEIVSDAWPFRIKSVHLINAPSYYRIAYQLGKMFFPKKILSRLHIHTSDFSNNIYKDIPKEIMPVEFGGLITQKEHDHFRKHMLSKDSFLERYRKYTFKGVPSTRHKCD